MKMHIITIGRPKLAYAQTGWNEYWRRLEHYHQLEVTHIPDKQNNPVAIRKAIGNSHAVVLTIEGQPFTSQSLARYLDMQATYSREISFIIGGPTGLPEEVIAVAGREWSLSQLTFPHDLAMVIVLEALYRASTINAGSAYHK